MLSWVHAVAITKSQAACEKQLMEIHTLTFDSQHFKWAKDLQNKDMDLLTRTP